MADTVVIDERFNGPPDSANGGYACGVVAAPLGPRATANLRLPPPLGVPLVRERENGTARLLRDGAVVAEAQAADPVIESPPAPSVQQAEQASLGFTGHQHHIFPTCFVCGPQHGDGLRIYPGPVPGTDILACTWTPGADLAVDGTEVDPVFVWAALDCPSGFACIPPGTVTVLASMTAGLDEPLRVGRTYVLTAWLISRDGRKHRAGSAIHEADGRRVAAAEALWITLKQ